MLCPLGSKMATEKKTNQKTKNPNWYYFAFDQLHTAPPESHAFSHPWLQPNQSKK